MKTNIYFGFQQRVALCNVSHTNSENVGVGGMNGNGDRRPCLAHF